MTAGELTTGADLRARCGSQCPPGQVCDGRDAGSLRQAAAVLRRRPPRQTSALRVIARVLELRADRIDGRRP
jgi:hypothetical protein